VISLVFFIAFWFYFYFRSAFIFSFVPSFQYFIYFVGGLANGWGTGNFDRQSIIAM
jgi:hypothetical protein